MRSGNVKYFSMYSGIGGFELGIERAFSVRHRNTQITPSEALEQGLESAAKSESHNRISSDTELTGNTRSVSCVGYSEIDKYAIKVYERRFSGHTNYGNADTINEKELPDFDLLVGGFPCQSFSIAGKRQGFNDTRGTQFFNIARILAEKRPRHLVLENVKGLLSHDSGKTFQTILRILSDLGYRVEWQVLNSKDFGVPQNRERVFIVGHLGDGSGRKVFPITRQGNKYSTLGKSTETSVARALTGGGHSGGNHSGMTIIAKTVRSGGRASPHGSKQNWDSYEHNGRIRRLTPKECERLQGFPDDWTKYGGAKTIYSRNWPMGTEQEVISDTQRYKMCGNAVTVDVVEAVMRRLYDSY